jgi:hypothetical protein
LRFDYNLVYSGQRNKASEMVVGGKDLRQAWGYDSHHHHHHHHHKGFFNKLFHFPKTTRTVKVWNITKR